ncbi:MAG: hypothetical protein Q9169_000523 [Polycauliona sp. 2 TL-2023]
MGHDNNFTSPIKHRLASPDDVLQARSGNEQNHGNRRRPAVLKAEDDDDAFGFERKGSRSTYSHSAQAAIKQQQKRARRAKRIPTKPQPWELLQPVELESDRYLAYRAKSRQRAKDRPNDKNNVWPDHLENAFQLALRVIPPVGRKKENVHREKEGDKKLCGRNELISQKIYEWTGIDRNRKQVSSHIQVLRGFFKHHEQWLQHVNAKDTSSPGRDGPADVVPEDVLHLQGMNLDNLSIEDYRILVHNPYGPIGSSVHKEALLCPPPNAILGSNAPDHGPRLNRIEFDMYVQSPGKEKIHQCTSIQAEIGASPQSLEQISNWRLSFPQLEDYHERGELEDNIILINSNIDLPPDHPPKNSTLSIQFKVNIAGASGNHQWSTSTNYYENNGEPVDMRKFYEVNNVSKTSSWDTPTVYPTPGSPDIQLEIPLHSIWWVQLFTKMASRKNGTMHDPYFSQQEEEWSRRYLQGMSIMQEVRMGSGAATKRVAIILWRFLPTRPGDVAMTSWRKLKPPPQRFKVNSPTHLPEPPLQHSMFLDSSLNTIAMPQPILACAGRFLHQQSDMFAQESERIMSESHSAHESPAPGLSPDYTTSFPSSTTASFPPSVTHGYLSHEESQESACYSQDSCSYRHESFASQHSFNFPHKTNYALQETPTYDEDLNQLPGNLELESQDPAYYSQQSLDPMPDFHSPIEYEAELCQDGLRYDGSNMPHDFPGGQIQLSFQTHQMASESHSPYVGPPTSIAHFARPVQADRRFSYDELHGPLEDMPARHEQPSTTSTSHPPNEVLDFSAWDAHFTPENLAALRSHDDGFVMHGGIHHGISETQHLGSHHTNHTSAENDWTIIQMKTHLQEAAVHHEQIHHQGAIVGEIDQDDDFLGEEIHDDENGDNNNKPGESFGFEEIYGPESQELLNESQAAEGQYEHEHEHEHDQHVSGGLENDYEDHDLNEDHL